MPYDRKTELLWSYIGIAQFSDFSKFWGQGPAYASSPLADFQTPASHLTPRGESDGGDVPANRWMPSETMSSSGSSTGSSHNDEFPKVTDEAPPHVGSIHAAQLMSEAHAASNSFPILGGGGIRFSHEISHETSHAPTPPAQHISTDSSVVAHTGPDAPALNESQTDATPAEPKIYGPSDVHMQGVITGGDNSQTSVVVANDGNEIHGWSGLGTETIGNLIDQVKTPDFDNPFHLSIDYVSGNLTSLTTFMQLNTIYDNDANTEISSVSAASHSLIGDTNVAQSIDSGGNQSFNTTTLVGNQALEGYDVLVVTGDLTKINKVMQVNLIVDDDVNNTVANGDINMPSGTATSVWDAAIQSGGNVEVNIGFIVDQQSGSVYLVGGFYGSTHSATQLNVLSDADLNDILQLFHAQEGTGFLDFSAMGSIVSGGNSQSNTAGFVDGGNGETHSGPPPVSDLTSLLMFAGLSPGDGDVKVLFVDGDYTIVNLVVQINVIHDSDHNTQIATADGAMGSLEAPAEPQHDAATATDGAVTGEGENPPTNHADAGNPDTPPDTTAGTGGPTPDHTDAGSTDAATGGTDHPQPTTSGDASHPAATESPGSTGTEPPDTTQDASTASGESADNTLPVYADHGNLNYDQITNSGGNEAGNHATLIDGGNGPQVQIVQGAYHEYNEIYQVNILFDTDHNRITSTMNSEASHPGSSDDVIQDPTHAVSADDVLHKMMT